MKKTSKLMALILALVMVFAIATPAMAATGADTKDPNFTTKVVVTKMGLTDLTGWPKEADGKNYDGNEITDLSTYFGTTKVLEGVAFQIYKIEGTTETLYKIDDQDTFLTNASGQIEVFLPNGTYKFVENKEASTYVGEQGETISNFAAVPFTITLPMIHSEGYYFDNSDHPLYVYPKNTEATKPSIEKTSTSDGTVMKGDTIPYTVTTEIKAGSTFKELSWNDRMSSGLTFDKNVELTTSPDLGLVLGEDYKITYDGNGFVASLTNTGLIKLGKTTAPTGAATYTINETDISGENLPVIFTLTYSATVNEEAIVESALENTVTLKYGNASGFTSLPGDKNPIPQTNVTQIPVSKSFVSGNDMENALGWPAGLTITLNLDVYNPTDNTWVPVTDKTLTLNSTTTTGTFTGLDESKTYRVVETEVKGWVPNYSIDDNTGNLVIKNRQNSNNPAPISPMPVIVRTFGKKFLKTDGNNTVLAGAEFVISDGNEKYLAFKDEGTVAQDASNYNNAQANYIKAIEDYNKAIAVEGTTEETVKITINGTEYTGKTAIDNEIKNLAKLRDDAYTALNTQYQWLPAADKTAAKALTNIVILTSNQAGEFEITGMDQGVYNLEEIKAPDGYALKELPVEFTVEVGSYASVLEVSNIKVTIPQTGGIGTVIFTVTGLVMMVAAFVILKRNNKEEIA